MSESQKRTPPRLIEVLERRELSPRVVEIVFGGAALAGFGPAWPAAHIKLFFPRVHQREPVLPTLNAEGRPIWPHPAERPVVRTYSTRAHDVARGTLTVEFVIHEPEGPASRWALNATRGMRIGLAGPGGPRPMLKSADWYLLIGDLSALPAITALLEATPRETACLAYIELDDERDVRALSMGPRSEVRWRIGKTAESGSIAHALAASELPCGTPQIWLAGESDQVVTLRDRLLERYPAARATMYAVPYWKRRESEEQYHQERHRIMDELALS